MTASRAALTTISNVLAFALLTAVSLRGTFAFQNVVLTAALILTVWAFWRRRNELRWGLLAYDVIGIGLLVLYAVEYEMR